MTTEQEIELERMRIRDLLTSLRSVLELIEASAATVASSHGQMTTAKGSLERAQNTLVKSASDVVEGVQNQMKELPGDTAKKIQEKLSGTIESAVESSVLPLTEAAKKVRQAATDLAVTANENFWRTVACSAVAGLVAGSAGGLLVFYLFRHGG